MSHQVLPTHLPAPARTLSHSYFPALSVVLSSTPQALVTHYASENPLNEPL